MSELATGGVGESISFPVLFILCVVFSFPLFFYYFTRVLLSILPWRNFIPTLVVPISLLFGCEKLLILFWRV